MENNVARTLLAASFPFLCASLPPPLSWPFFQASLATLPPPKTLQAFQIFTAERRAAQREQPPRPDQGGQRITEEWLRSLKTRDCLWCFR
jgi:hypothetical protein